MGINQSSAEQLQSSAEQLQSKAALEGNGIFTV